jgi:hypothetical protein
MKKKHLLFLLLFSFFKPLQAQIQLSAYSEISIVTVGPGTELFEAFGHSAIRIKDPVFKIDVIYNYGMFDFKAPNYYTNFVKGNMVYSLARYDFKYFLASSKRDKRWVKQQVLNLTQGEKQGYFRYLEQNALPKNAFYPYDPYYNNCATKLRDITASILGDKLKFNDSRIEKELSLRQLMDREIPWNTWGSFGINLALGSKLDRKATPNEYMYLPDYVFYIFKNATIFEKNQPKSLVEREDTLLDFKELKQEVNLLNPFLIFSIISFIGLLITYKDFKNKRRTKWFDFLLFLVTGLIGILILFLWFFTNHSTTPNNFNFLWAFAPNVIVAFFLLKESQQKWIHTYIYILMLFLGIIPFVWMCKIQQLPLSILPILVLLMVRYLFLSKRLLTFK